MDRYGGIELDARKYCPLLLELGHKTIGRPVRIYINPEKSPCNKNTCCFGNRFVMAEILKDGTEGNSHHGSIRIHCDGCPMPKVANGFEVILRRQKIKR
jgi:hypothetical protein